MTREEAIEWIENIKKKYIHGGDEAFDDARRKAVDMAIEALQQEPVKHGEWKYCFYKDINNTYVGVCECTVCKHREYSKHKYCPNCGAKMDGGKESEVEE